MVLFLLLALIASINVVSANDSNDAFSVSESIASGADSKSADNVIGSSMSSEDVLKDSSGTFTQLQECINNATPGSTIDLNMSYAYSDDVDSAYKNAGVVVDKELTINGNGYVLNGSNIAQILKITGNNVIVKNLTIANAFRNTGGAGIYWTGNDGTVESCTFVDNNNQFMRTDSGLCLYVSGSRNFTVNNSVFKTVTLKSNSTLRLYASGIYFTNSFNVLVNNTNFSRLTQSFYSSNCDKVVMTNCYADSSVLDASDNPDNYNWYPFRFDGGNVVFDNNEIACRRTSNQRYILYANGVDEFNMTNSRFPTICGSRGNILVMYVNNLLIDNCILNATAWWGNVHYNFRVANLTLTNNYLNSRGGYPSLFDINNREVQNLVVRNNTFVKCSKTDPDVAIFKIHVNVISGNIFNNTFDSNELNIVDSVGSSNDFYIFNNTISSNTEKGSLFSFSNADYLLFENNTINKFTEVGDARAVSGLFLHVTGTDLVFNNNTISGFSSSNKLTAAYSLSYIDVTNAIITNNTFYNNNINSAVGTGIIYNGADNSIIVNNSFTTTTCSAADGGDIYNVGDNVIIANNSFKSSNIGGIGGVIYNSGNDVRIEYNNFTSSRGSDGGVIYNIGTSPVIVYNNITNCYSTGDAGAFHIEGQDANISSNYFEAIYARNNYGVLYCQNAEGSLIYNNTYVNVNATNWGAIAIGNNITVVNQTLNKAFVTNGQAGTLMIMGGNNNIINITINNTHALIGGAIYNSGNDNNLTNITISNTKATSTHGGTIYSEGNNLNINGLIVNNSTANTDGGVIYNIGTDGKLYHVSFDKVSAGHDGGAIYWTGNGAIGDDINITNVNATRNGGAINWVGDQATLSNVKIINASAGADGGAIYWTGNNGKITSLIVDNANATNGGAVYWSGSNGEISTASFNNIRAKGDGGAIYWIGSIATLKYINFTNINTTASGGAIYGTSADSTMDTLSFNNVNATSNGGAIYWTGANSDLVNMIFNNTMSGANGGAIYWTGDKSHIRKSRFSNISASGNGGAVYWTGTNSYMDYVNFTNCNASGNGGAVYWTGVSSNITNSNFISNNAYSGAAISWSADYGNITNVNFTDNKVSNNGGAIYWIGKSADLSYLNITNNEALFKGAGIYLIGSNPTLHNLQFEDNLAGADGGAINIDGINGKVYESTFINNTAGINGGAISWLGTKGLLYHLNLTNNNASTGGAIYLSANNGTIYYVNFTNNSAVMGGALYMGGLNYGHVFDVNFTNNNATSSGGAIYWASNNGNLTNAIFDGANAIDGGAIFWLGNFAELSQINFTNVYASENGGILYITGSDVNITGAQFIKSTANNGGALYWTGINGKLDSVSFEKNNASNNGGGLYIVGSNFNLINANFTNNSANNFGGGIYWAGTGNVNNSNFTYNYAYGGSAIYNAGVLLINNTEILKNKANITAIEILPNDNHLIYLNLTAVLIGNDNFLNGIWTSSNNIQVRNVTYFGINGETVSDDEFITPVEGISETGLYYDPQIPNIFLSMDIKRDHSPLNDSYANYTDIKGSINYIIVKANDWYNITLDHPEDDYYVGFTNSTYQPFGMPYSECILRASNEMDYDGTINITVRLTGSGTSEGLVYPNATVEIYVDDEYMLDMELIEGNGLINTPLPINAGLHNMTAIFRGNSTPSIKPSTSNTLNFTVNRIPLAIGVSANASTVNVGDLININISASSTYNGSVYYIAGEYQDSVNLNGYYSFDVVYHENKTVTVFAYAEGDINYLPGMGNCSFNVIKKDTSMEFVNITGNTLNPINVGDAAIITVKFADNDTTGNVIITVDDANYTGVIVNGSATVIVHNLTTNNLIYLSHSVTAVYGGDDKYNSINPIMAILPVYKIDPEISITPDSLSILSGENAKLNISVISSIAGYNLNGFATVVINGSSYNVSINNGKGSLIVSGLKEGNYPINIIYNGDIQFNELTIDNIGTITVRKVDITSINVTPNNLNINIGENAEFGIEIISSVPENYTVNGYVIVNIGDKNYSVSISNGKGMLNISDLSNGTYDVNVFYLGDSIYNSYDKNNAAKIVVSKANILSIDVITVNPVINVGDDAVFNINVVPNTTNKVNGYITLSIGDNKYNVSIINNTGKLNISTLPNGTYYINVSYAGDSYYNSWAKNNISNITVSKVDIFNISVTPRKNNITIGENAIFDIEVISMRPDDYIVDGYVTVKINNIDYNVSISKGKGILSVPDLTNNTYTIGVYYGGDNTFNSWAADNINNLTVNKINISNIIITPQKSNLDVGDDAVFDITIATDNPEYVVYGYLTLNVGDMEYNISISNNKGSLIINNLNEGKYSVDAYYAGNKVYNNWEGKNLTSISVNKINISSIKINPLESPIYVGEDAVFNINVLSNSYPVNGYVTVTINNKEYEVLITNGVGLLTISDLKNGTYYVDVNYKGDNQFNSKNIDNISSITVNKMDIVSIRVNPVESYIYVGDDAVFNINMTSAIPNKYSVNGYATIRIDNKNYTVAITNGTATLTVNGLTMGAYPVDIIYDGDDQFNSKTINSVTYININKVDIPYIEVNVNSPIYVGEDALFNIVLTTSDSNIRLMVLLLLVLVIRIMLWVLLIILVC